MRKRNTFLVGDAAHVWPTFGAMGGNTGYGDAMNLGWKLANAVKQRVGPNFLDSYEAERHQHIMKTAMFVIGTSGRPHLA